MPEYDYKCEKCKTITSVFTRSVKDELHPECSKCKSTNMTRQIGMVAFKVKGRMPGPAPMLESMHAQFEQMGVPMPNAVRERIDRQTRGESPVPTSSPNEAPAAAPPPPPSPAP